MAREFVIGMKGIGMNKTAFGISIGDVCKVVASYGELTSALEGNQLKILRSVVRQGGGKVVVESITGRNAYVYSYGNPMSRVMGGVNVPIGFLKVVDADKAAKNREDIIASRIVADEVDPMAGEKLSSLYVMFHTWATKKATSLPPGAPVVTQIIDGMSAVTNALKGKSNVTGKLAVQTLYNAMKGTFDTMAQPFPYLMRKYGKSLVLDTIGEWN